MTVTLANLRTLVTNTVGNHAMRVSALASGDGERLVFMLPDGGIESGTVVIYVDSVAKTTPTHWSMDYDVGELTFVSAPASGTDNIEITYYTTPFSEDQVDDAINHGIDKVWPFLNRTKLDIATIVPDSQTFEYELPADCAYLKRVDYRSASGQPYKVQHGWRVIDDTDTGASPEQLRYLYLYNPPSTGTIRLHYIPLPTYLSATDDTLEFDAMIPTRAKWAIVYYACADLKRTQYMRRSATNIFHGAEKQNVVKLFELQRAINDMEMMAKLEVDAARMTPRAGMF